MATQNHEGDLRLARRCIEGEHTAWEEFVELYSGTVHKTVVCTLVRINLYSLYESHVEDIYAEAFRFLLENLKKFEGRSSLKTWLVVCVKNLTLHELRRLRRHVQSEEDLEAEEYRLSDPGEPAEAAYARRDLIAKVEGSLFESLSPKGRIFYKLIFKKDLPVKEIQAMLDVSADVVRMWKMRITKMLREIYQDMEEAELGEQR